MELWCLTFKAPLQRIKLEPKSYPIKFSHPPHTVTHPLIIDFKNTDRYLQLKA